MIVKSFRIMQVVQVNILCLDFVIGSFIHLLILLLVCVLCKTNNSF